jgi:transposase
VSIETGIDGGKNVNGRKRHFAVDSLGLPIAIRLNFFRRLDKDHEKLPESAIAFIQIAFTSILLK